MAQYFAKIYFNSFIVQNTYAICSVLPEKILSEQIEFDNTYVIEVLEKSIKNINKIDIVLSKNEIKRFNSTKQDNRVSFNIYNNISITISKIIRNEETYYYITTIDRNKNFIVNDFFSSSGNDNELYQTWYSKELNIEDDNTHVINIKKE